MDKNIKVFLESPKTLELASESAITKAKLVLKTRIKKKTKKLPPFIPRKSIFEEKDLSKLTERQRILATKFQSMNTKPNSLFLAVNNITNSFIENNNIVTQPCNSSCYDDCERLSNFTKWLANKHCCKQKGKMTKLLKELNTALNMETKCVCIKEKVLYSKAISFLNLECCKK